MTVTAAPPRHRGFLTEWLCLLGALLVLGSYISYWQYQEFKQLDTIERDRLASQAAVIEKNLVPQLALADHVIKGIAKDIPHWSQENDGFDRANHELKVMNDTLIGIRPILVIGADGSVLASSNEKLVGQNFAHRE